MSTCSRYHEQIGQIAIPVQDLDRAVAFYRDMLGLPFLFQTPPGLAFFQCGEVRLMLSRPEGVESAQAAVRYYKVADINKPMPLWERARANLLMNPI